MSDLVIRALLRARGRRARLGGVNLSWRDLRGLDLSWVKFARANLRGIDARGVDFRGVDFTEADLSESDLRWSDCRGVKFRGTDLTDTDIREAIGLYDLSEDGAWGYRPVAVQGLNGGWTIYVGHQTFSISEAMAYWRGRRHYIQALRALVDKRF